MRTTTAIIIIVILAIIGYGIYNARGVDREEDAATTTPNTSGDMTTEPEWNVNAAGLGILIVKNGAGPAAQVGDTVSVHYTGTLEDGTAFDSSVGKSPLTFTLGEGRVIAGWEQGILGMQVGERRRLDIPPELAYGERGAPPVIPPSAVLLFDVELVAIR